ncbi:MAG: PQQ-binding-like beta-propeller repeat protein [Pirellulales bacterium]
MIQRTRAICRPLAVALAAALAVLLIPRHLPAQEWTRFRGPNGTGLSQAANIPTTWTDEDFNWKVELPGIGHSCPVVWKDQVYLTSADNETALRHVLAISTVDGRTVWERKYTSTTHNKHQLNSFASPTPTVDEERAYFVWSSPEDYSVHALAHDGQELWHRSLGPFVSQHSCGTSPIVVGDLLILNNDQDGASFLVALNRRTGEPVWQAPRNSREVAYSTPCLYEPPGAPPELIFNSGAHGITSIDPATGQKNWEIDVFDKRSVSSPVIAAGLIFGTCGSGGGGNYVVAVRPGKADGSVPPQVAYKITKSAPYVPTPIAKDSLVFLWSDQGVATCIVAATGEVVWQNRVGGKFYGSPICIEDRLYCISTDGEVVVLSAGPEYVELARNNLGEGSHSTPAVADGVLYLRTFSHLFSLGKKSS